MLEGCTDLKLSVIAVKLFKNATLIERRKPLVLKVRDLVQCSLFIVIEETFNVISSWNIIILVGVRPLYVVHFIVKSGVDLRVRML